MEMAYCRMIYLCYPSSTRIWTRLSAWFVRTLCFSRVLSAYVMLRKSVWRLLSFLVQDAEWDGHICLLLLENCLLQSLVVVKVFSLPMCTFDALTAWLREQLWLVKLSENHNSIYRKVKVAGLAVLIALLKKNGMKSVRVPSLKLVFIAR